MHRPYEIMFVDDVSRDRTREIIRGIVAAAHPDDGARRCSTRRTQGRGPTVTDGFRAARGAIAGFLDVDLEVHARYIPSLVRAIERGRGRGHRAPDLRLPAPARSTATR